jgi:hypothetical protein
MIYMQGGLLQVELLTPTTGTEDAITVGTVLGPCLEMAIISGPALTILDEI